jgi:phage tail sheath protein FI
VSKAGSPTETYANLAMDSRHSRYFANIVQSALISIDYSDPPSTTSPAKNVPATLNPAAPLAGGVDESLGALTAVHYTKGISSLRRTPDVNLIAVPDAVGSKMAAADTQAIQTALVNHCETLQDRFGILDSRPVQDPNNFAPAITQQRSNLDSDNGYAALYFPWIKIASPFDSTQILVPPSGHTMGVFANNDNTRGVFKAPANEPITMALDVELPLADADQGLLNDVGINCIRQFPNQGIRIWGARTITPPDSTQWRYVNIRRLLIFIEKSIQGGTRFAVFEPNNLTLWGKVKRVVDDFLTGVWSAGALEGATPAKSFLVRIDDSLNPPASIALGILTVEVTIFPAPPAEFVVFQIIQEPGGSFVNEQAA